MPKAQTQDPVGWVILHTTDEDDAHRIGVGQRLSHAQSDAVQFRPTVTIEEGLERAEVVDPVAFRLVTDDGDVAYRGVMRRDWLEGDEELAFAPLQFGQADWGCTDLQYREDNRWVILLSPTWNWADSGYEASTHVRIGRHDVRATLHLTEDHDSSEEDAWVVDLYLFNLGGHCILNESLCDVQPGDGPQSQRYLEQIAEGMFPTKLRRSLSDEEALDQMNEILSAPDWGTGMLEDLNEILRSTGRTEVKGAEWLRH